MSGETIRIPWLPEGRTVQVPGRGEAFARIHRHADPAAPTLLLLHGWTASGDLQFFTAYEALAERYSFVAVDHHGHGRGLRNSTPFSLEAAADDAAFRRLTQRGGKARHLGRVLAHVTRQRARKGIEQQVLAAFARIGCDRIAAQFARKLREDLGEVVLHSVPVSGG